MMRRIIFFCFVVCSVLAQHPSMIIKVLLLHAMNDERVTWQLEAAGGFIVKLPNAPEDNTDQTKAWKMGAKRGSITIVADHGAIFINGRPCALPINIAPFSVLETKIGDLSYAGTFSIVADTDRVFLINCVELEEYVNSVLRWESWPAWPLEVQKAQAILCRTYVVRRILDARAQQGKTGIVVPYDIRCTNIHQTYKGTHQYHQLKEAVESTRAVIVSHNKKPIVAMYDACCGGIVPAHIAGIDFASMPYLKRVEPCTYCKKCRVYAWSVEYPIAECEELLRTNLGKTVKLKEFRIGRKDKAGVVHELHVTGDDGMFHLTGRATYSLFKDIKSYAFEVSKTSKKIIFKGTGLGHHMGLCQWGGREMIKRGKKYTDVLSFYYPGTSLMKIKIL